MGTHPEEVTVLVSETVSEALEVPIEALPPLSDAISVDALETITTSPSTVTVTFTYAGLYIFVTSENTVYVRPIQSEEVGINNRVAPDDW